MLFFFFFQAEDGIRDLVRSRGLGDVYKRQLLLFTVHPLGIVGLAQHLNVDRHVRMFLAAQLCTCLLYTSDAADERSSVDLGGRRIIKKKNIETSTTRPTPITHKHKD